jgi:hypothetical protein
VDQRALTVGWMAWHSSRRAFDLATLNHPKPRGQAHKGEIGRQDAEKRG